MTPTPARSAAATQLPQPETEVYRFSTGRREFLAASLNAREGHPLQWPRRDGARSEGRRMMSGAAAGSVM
jgi:hypothetical protein